MMKYEVTKENILLAAQTNPEAEIALRHLFPEAFEEDTLAIKKGVFNESGDGNLMAFCRMAFGYERVIDIAFGLANNKETEGRVLYVNSGHQVKMYPSDNNAGATILEIHRRK